MQARRVNHTVFSTAVIKHKNRGAARYFSSNLCAYKFKEDVCVCMKELPLTLNLVPKALGAMNFCARLGAISQVNKYHEESFPVKVCT